MPRANVRITADVDQAIRSMADLKTSWVNAASQLSVLKDGFSAVSEMMSGFVAVGSRLDQIDDAIADMGAGPAGLVMLRKAVGDSVDQLVLAQNAARALRHESTLTMKDLTDLYQWAIYKGRAVGMSAEESVKQITDAITKGNIEAWDKFGVKLDETVNRSNALKLGLEKVRKELKAVNNIAKIAVESIEERQARIKNQFDDIYRMFIKESGMWESLKKDVTGFFDYITTHHIDTREQARKLLDEFNNFMKRYTREMGTYQLKLREAQLKGDADAEKLFQERIKRLERERKLRIEALIAVEDEMRKFLDYAIQMEERARNTKIQGVKLTSMAVAKENEQIWKFYQAMRDQFKDPTKYVKELKQGFDTLTASIINTNGSLQNLNSGALGITAKIFSTLGLKMKVSNEVMRSLTKASKENTEQVKKQAEEVNKLAKAQIKIASQYDTLRKGWRSELAELKAVTKQDTNLTETQRHALDYRINRLEYLLTLRDRELKKELFRERVVDRLKKLEYERLAARNEEAQLNQQYLEKQRKAVGESMKHAMDEIFVQDKKNQKIKESINLLKKEDEQLKQFKQTMSNWAWKDMESVLGATTKASLDAMMYSNKALEKMNKSRKELLKEAIALELKGIATKEAVKAAVLTAEATAASVLAPAQASALWTAAGLHAAAAAAAAAGAKAMGAWDVKSATAASSNTPSAAAAPVNTGGNMGEQGKTVNIYLTEGVIAGDPDDVARKLNQLIQDADSRGQL